MFSKEQIKNQLPNHFLEEYPQFIQFLEQYYQFLEATILELEDTKNVSVGDILYGSLSKSKAEVKTVSSGRVYVEYQIKENNFYKNEILLNQKSGADEIIIYNEYFLKEAQNTDGTKVGNFFESNVLNVEVPFLIGERNISVELIDQFGNREPIRQDYFQLQYTKTIHDENNEVIGGNERKIISFDGNKIDLVNKFEVGSKIIVNYPRTEFYQIKSVYNNIYNYIQKIEDNTCYDMALNIYKKYFKKNVSLDTSVFRRVDPEILTKRILNYYRNKGSENSFYWFFRIFFDENIELYYPKVDILRLSSSDYKVRRWVQVKYVDGIQKMKSASLITNRSPISKEENAIQATAIVREVHSTSAAGINRTFLDLVFVNGTFEVGEEIIANDYITNEEIGRTKIIPSAVEVHPTDGGISHQKGDAFRFGSLSSDGRGEVIEMEKYSITNIIPEHRGVCYSVGNEIKGLNDPNSGATSNTFAKAVVTEIHPNPLLTNWINSYIDDFRTVEISEISSEAIVDIWDMVIGQSLTEQAAQNQTISQIQLVRDRLESISEVGSIKKIEFEKSGMNYRLAPDVHVTNDKSEQIERTLKNFIFIELIVDDRHLDHFEENTSVEVLGRRGFCTGIKKYDSAPFDIDFDLQSESFSVAQIIIDKEENDAFADTQIDSAVNDQMIDYLDHDTYFDSSEIVNSNNMIRVYEKYLDVYHIGNIDPITNTINSNANIGVTSSVTLNVNSNSLVSHVNYQELNFTSVVKITYLHETAEIHAVLGEGVSKLKLTELGLIGGSGLAPKFKENIIERIPNFDCRYQTYDEFFQKLEFIYEEYYAKIKLLDQKLDVNNSLYEPGNVTQNQYDRDNLNNDYLIERRVFGGLIEQDRFDNTMDLFYRNEENELKSLIEEITFDKTRISHNLPATLEYQMGALYKPFGEYVGRGSQVSADKYMQDNYYYQNFSYEIRTKVQASDIEPLLMDELHPAGFIMFVRNKFESEMKLRLNSLEFPEIEVENFAKMKTIADKVQVEVELNAKPDNHPGMIEKDILVEPEVEVNIEEDLSVIELHEKEIEMEKTVKDLEAFHYFWEDVVSIPQEFNLNNLQGYLKKSKDLGIINSTTGKRRGIDEAGKFALVDLLTAAQSYTIIKMVEDSSNWRTVPIRQRGGAIGQLGEEPIRNLRTSSDINFQMTNSYDFGGVIIVRDDPYSTPLVVGNSNNSLENHGFMPGAQVYTKTGWVSFQSLFLGQEIAHVEESGKIVWKPIKKIHRQKFDGNMHHVTNAKAITTTFVPALDRMVLKNIHAPIAGFSGQVVVPHKAGIKADDASAIVAPETNMVLFTLGSQYQKVESRNVNYTDRVNYISAVNEDLIDLPVSIINRYNVTDFKKEDFRYTGDIYTVVLEDIQPSAPIRMQWREIDLMFQDVAIPKNQPKFAIEVREILQKISNISEIRSVDPTLTDLENRSRIEAVKFEETVMYLLNVNDERKGAQPKLLDDRRLLRFDSTKIDSPIRNFAIKTNIINEKLILDRYKCFDVNENILPNAPISSLMGGRLKANMRETIPTVKIGDPDYSIFNITAIENIKPKLVERYDQIHLIDELFMELSTNQVCFFINSTNNVLPTVKSEGVNATIYVESEGEKHETELIENVIDVEKFAMKNMFMKLEEHPLEVEIHRHLPDRWKCTDINETIPFDEVIGSNNLGNQKIWQNMRESIPTARVVETARFLSMYYDETMKQELKPSDQEVKVITENSHLFVLDGNMDLIEVEIDEHYSLPEITPLVSESEIHKYDTKNLRKEQQEKDSTTHVVSSQGYKLELKTNVDALDLHNETIIYNRNYIFDAKKPIDVFGNQPIKDYYLKLRPRLSIRDTLPSGEILEFAVDIHTQTEVETADLLTLVEEAEVEIDNTVDSSRNLLHRETGFKLQNVSRIWNSNYVYEMNMPIYDMTNVPVEDLSKYALKESMDRISVPNGTTIIENFEIHQEIFGSNEIMMTETEYHIVPDLQESTPVTVTPLSNEIEFEKNPQVSVEFMYSFEKEIRTERIIGELVTEKNGIESSVHAMDSSELELFSDVLFHQKGGISKTQREEKRINENQLDMSPIYKILKKRIYTNPFGIDEVSINFLTSQWATPFFDEVIEDYEDKILHDRDDNTYLHYNLNIQYVYPESFIYEDNIELLNSSNYIDENGTTLPAGSFTNYGQVVNSSNTYIKTLSVIDNIRTLVPV